MDPDESMEKEFEAALLALDRLTATRLLSTTDGDPLPLQRVERLVVPALERIGRGWEQGRIALSQVYMSGRICEELVDALLPATGTLHRSRPKIALALLEDYHLLGKRMVYAVLRAGGYEVRDYGRVDVTSLVRRTCEEGIEILLISTLMLPSALRVAKVREELDRCDCRVRIGVGGAPFRFDDQLWREVGADAMGRNASDVVTIIDRLSGGQP